MKFAPKSEKEVTEANLKPEGIYDAEIGTAEDKVSSSGNDMIQLDLTVFDKEGNKFFVYDYLLEKMAFKLRHAADACGLLDKYANGTLTADDFVNKCCKVKVKIQEAKGDYNAKNVIADYIVSDKPKKEAVDKDIDDSIPF